MNAEEKCAEAPLQETSTEYEIIHLDYTLKTAEERVALTHKIIEKANPKQLTNKYLEILSNYVLAAMDKEEKKEKKLLTDNRMVTVNKRETSYEGLVAKYENGEDGVYNLINTESNALLSPKLEITDEDIAEIPELKKIRDTIKDIELKIKTATGKAKYSLKKTLIDLYKDQYIIKAAFKPNIVANGNLRHGNNSIELYDDIHFDAEGEPVNDGLISFFNPTHISAILCNYEILETGLQNKLTSDFRYMFEDFNKLLKQSLAKYPLYRDLVQYKIAGKQNLEIQQLLFEKHGIKHSVEYISALWRQKIPKLIAEQAKENYIIWYYTYIEKGTWKKCSRCGQYKLAHNRFFSKNNTSKDHFYSICKECRNKKKGE